MQRRFLHRFQAPCGAIFSSQLCQLLTTRPFSREQKQTLPKVSKKGSPKSFLSINIHHSNISPRLPQLLMFNTGLGGWAKDDFPKAAPAANASSLQNESTENENVRRPSPTRTQPLGSPVLSLSVRAPPARASCLVRVRLVSRLPPQQRRLPRLSAFACGNLRCRRRHREKSAHSGENCILVYNAKAVPPPVSGSCTEPYFRPNSVSC